MSFSPKKIEPKGKAPEVKKGKLFYDDKNIQLWNGDARKMDFIPDKTVHVIITSPPYNVAYDYGKDWNDVLSPDDYFEFTKQWIKECYRVLVKGGRLIVNVPAALTQSAGSKIAFVAMDIWNIAVKEIGFLPRDWIIWSKIGNLDSVTSWGSWMSPSSPFCRDACEFIIVFSKEQFKLESKNKETDITKDEFMTLSRNIWRMVPAQRKLHPAPFPLEFPLRAIKFFSFVGDTILDPFVGSGTTVLACKLLKRKGIGVDISSKFLEVAKQRVSQQLLFDNNVVLTKFLLLDKDNDNLEHKQIEFLEDKNGKK